MTASATHTWQTKDGFEQLFKVQYQPLCAFAFGILKDEDVSEEIVQEVFVKLWAGRESMEITTSIKSYLYSAVRNSSLNTIKHLKVKEEYKKYNKAERDKTEVLVSDELVGCELDQQIKTAIAGLPEEPTSV